jgi:hypothetical protein
MTREVLEETRNGNFPNAIKKLYRSNLARYPD